LVAYPSAVPLDASSAVPLAVSSAGHRVRRISAVGVVRWVHLSCRNNRSLGEGHPGGCIVVGSYIGGLVGHIVVASQLADLEAYKVVAACLAEHTYS